MSFSRLKVFFALLSLIFLGNSAFSVKEYFYPKETLNDVSYENFTAGGANHTLIKIKGRETFLLKNEEAVENATSITPVIKNYYRERYYPTDGEIANIKKLVFDYNKSRNDGGKFPGKEENVCRDLLLLNGIKLIGSQPTYCVDNQSCHRIAQVFYSAPYTEGVRQTIPYPKTLALLESFAWASDTINNATKDAFKKLNELDEDSINNSFTSIKNSIPSIRVSEATLESSLFRTPKDDSDRRKCITEKCFGLCPDISLNESVLNILESNLTTALAKVAPFANYRTISGEVANQTKARLSFKTGEKKAEYYIAIFEPAKKDTDAAIGQGEELSRRIANDSLVSQLKMAKNLTKILEDSINNRSFQTIDNDLSEYENVSKSLKGTIENVKQFYNNTLTAKKESNALIFILENKETGARNEKKAGELLETSRRLDAAFSGALTDSEYTQLSASYKNLKKGTQELLKKLDSEDIFQLAKSKFRAYVKNVNHGFASLLKQLNVIPLYEVSANPAIYFGGIAVFVFLSLSSLVVMFFIWSLTKLALKKGVLLALGATVLFIVILSLLFSGGLYIYLTKTALTPEIEEFQFDFSKHDKAAIALDFRSAPENAIQKMQTCANAIKDSVTSKNKTVSVYKFQSEGCVANERAADMKICEMALKKQTAVYMTYSSTAKKPTLSSIYESKIQLAGDAAYYDTCAFSALFR